MPVASGLEVLERTRHRLAVIFHRSHAINFDFVRSLEPHDATRLEVEMRDGTRIVASRTRSRELRALIR